MSSMTASPLIGPTAKKLLKSDEITRRIFLPGGKVPAPGTVHVQSELALTLRLIAQKGRAGFYEGEVAEDIVNRLRALGGLHTLQDFAATEGNYTEPVSTEYRGYRIHQMPPNTQGLTALLMLNVLSGFDIADLDPVGAARLHLEIEAGRLAYRERDLLIGDQDFAKVPVGQLLSVDHANRLRREIDANKAMKHLPDVEMAMSDTVYISIVDKDRNAVSFINSTFHSFGSGITSPRTGVVLQNRGSSFKLDSLHPNGLAPGKRPMHTIMPGMVTKAGHAVMPFGVMGGDYQPFGHAHLISNLFDFGMDPQEALDSARVFYENGTVSAERGIPAEAIAGLKELGHNVTSAEEPFGGGQAIWIDRERGTLSGASDPRKDGCAIGF